MGGVKAREEQDFCRRRAVAIDEHPKITDHRCEQVGLPDSRTDWSDSDAAALTPEQLPVPGGHSLIVVEQPHVPVEALQQTPLQVSVPPGHDERVLSHPQGSVGGLQQTALA